MTYTQRAKLIVLFILNIYYDLHKKKNTKKPLGYLKFINLYSH